MRFFTILLASLFLYRTAVAQTQSLVVAGAGTGSSGYVRFNDASGLMNSKVGALEYGDIDGNCFWDSHWNQALLILKNGNGVKLKKVKLNFYSNDIHYLEKDGTELTAVKGMVRKIVFFDQKDTVKSTAAFQSFASFSKPGTLSYLQILNEGEIQLLKENSISLKKKDYDPFIGKDKFKFVSVLKYFIQEKGIITQLKGLHKTSVLSIVKSTDKLDEWLKSTHNKLNDEQDVIAFLEFINSATKN